MATQEIEPALDLGSVVIRLLITGAFVLLNAFFVAAEFALIKAQPARMRGSAPNKVVQRVERLLCWLELYLSSCQLGITVCSLILGWLAEPAVASIIVSVAHRLGMESSSALVQVTSLGFALTVVTVLTMTIGELAPKMLAISRPEKVAAFVALPLVIVTSLFRPLIRLINLISGLFLRPLGIDPNFKENLNAFGVDELKSILAASFRAGHISARQRQLADNIFAFMNLEVRHIMIPRVRVVSLSINDPIDRSLAQIRQSRHSRFPLCEGDLDGVRGIVHAKELLRALCAGEEPDLSSMTQEAKYVPDTQPLSKMMLELQKAGTGCAIVVDEHGTAIGMAFLEDAIEEIVGPLRDEFDDDVELVTKISPDITAVDARLSLPEAAVIFHLKDASGDDEDTIGGYFVSRLKRLPEVGDMMILGQYSVEVTEVERRSVRRLLFKRRFEQ